MSRIDPVAGADAVRARVPAALAAYAEARATVLEAGIVDRDLKALCASAGITLYGPCQENDYTGPNGDPPRR